MILWFIISMYLVFVPISCTEHPEFPVESSKSFSCYGNDATFETTWGLGLIARRTNHGIGGLEPSVSPPPPHIWGWERDWRLNPSPVANDIISHACVMKPPYIPMRTGYGELPSWWTHGGAGTVACLERMWKLCLPTSPCPMPLFHLTVPEL